ncbi:hypothetical protein P4B35_19295 [Pontiellaceae bacterium B12227]|nr:hypothetical protein [Pontiellaceae bacterium B12227]
MEEHMITVKDLKRMLEAYDDDMKLDFYPLSFSRLKQRAEDIINIEYNELVSRNEEGDLTELKEIPQHILTRMAEKVSQRDT